MLLLLGSLVLVGAATAAHRASPRWAAAAIAAPVVLCGGLSLVAGGTLLPQVLALPAFVLAVLGAVAVVLDARA